MTMASKLEECISGSMLAPIQAAIQRYIDTQLEDIQATKRRQGGCSLSLETNEAYTC
jgi:hypothetical protein